MNATENISKDTIGDVLPIELKYDKQPSHYTAYTPIGEFKIYITACDIENPFYVKTPVSHRHGSYPTLAEAIAGAQEMFSDMILKSLSQTKKG